MVTVSVVMAEVMVIMMVVVGLVAGEPGFLHLGGGGCRPRTRHVPHYKTIAHKVRMSATTLVFFFLSFLCFDISF